MSDFRKKAFISFYFILLRYTIAIKASFKKKKKKQMNPQIRDTEVLKSYVLTPLQPRLD